MPVHEIVDSHHHLWRERDLPRAGILAAPYLRRDRLWKHFQRAWDGLPVRRSVFVQVREDAAAELAFARSVARAHPALAAFVPWAWLERPGVRSELLELARDPLVRGVRRSTQHESDPLFCAREGYVAGARALGELGLLCEVCVRHEQLEGVVALARACPETVVVLEHLGKPDVSGPPPARWLAWMAELGRLPNVFCKLSVVVHDAADAPLAAETQAPFLRHVVDCFGYERVLFGSNWPVAGAVTGYRDWVEMLAAALPGASVVELGALFSANARRLYYLA